MADWKSFEVSVPGKDLLEPVQKVLETLLIFLDILKVVLDTIKTFLIDFGNPLKVLVQALIKLIEELFLSLKVSGVFGYFDVPDPTSDPNFDRFSGGFEAFVNRFKGSLFDTKDFNRPQPRQGSTQSGFVLLVVDAAEPFSLLNRMRQLLRFFGKELTAPRYEAPTNLKVLPVGSSGDPILAVAKIFTEGPIEAVELSWTLPTSTETPDPGFTDVITKFASEFVPPSFVIEKSVEVNPASARIDLAAMSDPTAAGIVEYDRPVDIDPSLVRFPITAKGRITRREILRDGFGDPVIKFQKYLVIGVATTILGQLGKFRYIDSDVVPNKTYYYRVRPYSGELAIDSNGQLIDPATSVDKLSSGVSTNSSSKFFKYPSTSDEVVLGKPTGIISTKIPTTPDFDVIKTLRNVFETAFSLDFHLELPKDALFDSSGAPIGGTPPAYVGRGSLFNQAGMLAAFQSVAILDYFAQFETVGAALGDSNQVVPVDMPWTRFNVLRQSYRLTDAVTSAMLQNGPDAVQTFRDFMKGPLPRGPIDTQKNLAGLTDLSAIVAAFTTTDENGKVDAQGVETFIQAYEDVPLRQNLLVVIQFLQSFTLGGSPVDWISIQPLRDIIPWSGQFLYDLLDKIQGLVDAFNGTMDEIKDFIDLIERKIDALERFIEFLIEILSFIESLEFSVFLLAASGISGDAFEWASIIDNAGGTKPSNNPGGYSAGIGLAYVAPDISAIGAAFSIIFGV